MDEQKTKEIQAVTEQFKKKLASCTEDLELTVKKFTGDSEVMMVINNYDNYTIYFSLVSQHQEKITW